MWKPVSFNACLGCRETKRSHYNVMMAFFDKGQFRVHSVQGESLCYNWKCNTQSHASCDFAGRSKKDSRAHVAVYTCNVGRGPHHLPVFYVTHYMDLVIRDANAIVRPVLLTCFAT